MSSLRGFFFFRDNSVAYSYDECFEYRIRERVFSCWYLAAMGAMGGGRVMVAFGVSLVIWGSMSLLPGEGESAGVES